ncbi:hypothetical protein NP493_629g00020 [Ridgeia piscesae]|uniref:Ig-like domain-containing protein n=1 Tax=Ridgeia piscesae TaxID=27915 RepID=A0AAD9NNK3_RIDPI|nr:hypothetical protein NP493_629g00020 [Ridgeia piscesae]
MAMCLQCHLWVITGILLCYPVTVSPSPRSLSPSPSDCLIVTMLRLKHAECRNRNLKVIPNDLDIDIKVLKFSDNQLTYLGMDEFRNYKSLQEIYLARNRIDAIAPDAFRGLTNLQILDLEGNELTTVPAQAFQYVSTMRILNMQNNPIRYVGADAFQHLRNIEEVNLENCWLEGLHPDAFTHLNQLNEINLVNNELKGLSAQMVLPPSLHVLRLYRNPWLCDCRLRWLREWISTTTVNWDFARNTPVCAAPEVVHGRSWKDLPVSQFMCAAKTLGNSSVFLTQINIGENITFDCNVFGDPQPRVVWTHGSKVIDPDADATKYMVVETGGATDVHSALTLWLVEVEDAGVYKCVAENEAGVSYITYRLVVTALPLSSDTGFSLFPLSTMIIVLIGATGAVIIFLLAAIMICCLRQRDRKRHKYKVREYKYTTAVKAPKKCVESKENIDTEEDSVKDDTPVSLPSTQLLLGETLDIESITEDTSEFKMKIFTYAETPKESEHRKKQAAIVHGAYPTTQRTVANRCCDKSNVLPVAPDLISHEPHSPYMQTMELMNSVAPSSGQRAQENRYVTSSELKPAIKLHNSALYHSADSINSVLSQNGEPRKSNGVTRSRHPVTFSDDVQVQTIPGTCECRTISHPIPGHERSQCRNPVCNREDISSRTLPRQHNDCLPLGVGVTNGNGCASRTMYDNSGHQGWGAEPTDSQIRPTAVITASLVNSLGCMPKLSGMPGRSSSLQNGALTLGRAKKPSLRTFASSSLDDILSPPFQCENTVLPHGGNVNNKSQKDTVV